MGKLTIEGKATKEYAYDLMEISVEFWATEGSTAAALKRVTQQSEDFLKILQQAGIKPEDIRIGNDSTKKSSFDSRIEVEVRRELKIRIPFNMDFLNFVRDTVQKNALDADVEAVYKFSDLDAIHRELIQLALEDSRTKANYIAESMGQRVTGIKTMIVGNTRGKNMIPRPSCRPDDQFDGCYYNEMLWMLSRRVQAPLSTETDSVEVVWMIQ